MAFDYWTKFTSSRNRDIYPPSRRSRACARDPATLVPPREGARPEHEIAKTRTTLYIYARIV
jgi:hypothetical protein